MTTLKTFARLVAVIAAIFFMNSCEEDFNTIGSDLVDSNNFESLLFENTQLSSQQLGIERIQTNALAGHLLGVYQDDVYGQTTANVLTQLALQTTNPQFGNFEMDSVILTLPYFTTAIGQDENGTIYELDSVYGTGPFKLSLFRSNFLLRDFDPDGGDFTESQPYFSDQQQEFENNLESEPILVIDEFEPSSETITLKTESEENEADSTIVEPRLRVALDTTFFKETIFENEGNEVLLSNNNFQNFFRGLYFKAEPINNDGSMIYFNFDDPEANITIYYKSDVGASQSSSTTGEVIARQFALNFADITVNTFNTPNSPTFDEGYLYLKGGNADITEVNLFNDQAQLDSIRDLNWLVNEANLTFFVAQNRADLGPKEPERLFVYDLNNNTVLLDYTFDVTASEINPLNSRTQHSQRLVRKENLAGSTFDETQPGVFYKIRLTEHVKNIIQNDSTNTRLGISITPNIEIVGETRAVITNEEGTTTVPESPVLTPESTVLHGVDSPDANKRLKLRIFYTKPD